ncbi:MAG: hypothetical protein E7549_03510 [Ruminococcaceae bacterium]|nr:hypothetical protein [Oscillospiraceae bacterium]
MANTFTVTPCGQTEANDLIGRCFAGYQLWFGSPDCWGHWSPTKEVPSDTNYRTEMFPDCVEYPPEALHDTAFSPYPDGTPVRLYASKSPATIDTHFRWMKEYGIDGVGVQRFFGATSAEYAERDDFLAEIMRAAECHGRLAYMMYDTSGYGGGGEQALARMKADVEVNVEPRMLASPAYAHAHGRPVMCVWGLSPLEGKRYPPADEALELVRWLKERGYFVIGGLPDNSWAEETGPYAAVYAALDMISPWTPGRFREETLAAWVEDHLARDLAYVHAHGQEYQPVLHAGFAWSNFKSSGDPNVTPRTAGAFLWEQAKRYAAAGVRQAYFAMLDEYDEGTALLKAAPDSYALPNGTPYFQTLAADGFWLSSDFYLRLGGAVAKTLRGECAVSDDVPVPHSEGPVFWRNGFEMREACAKVRGGTATARLCAVDVCVPHGKVLEQEAVQLEVASVLEGAVGDVCATGRYAFGFAGVCMSAGRCRVTYRLAKTAVTVSEGLTLSYKFRPLSAEGDCVGVDLLLDDGTRLSQYLPAALAPKGVFGGEDTAFADVELVLPEELVGRTVTAVLVAYDAAGEGYFKAYLDDIILQR